MCGLCGIAYDDPRRSPEHAALARMASAIEHRGPDDQGTWVRNNIGVGFQRLSIIDVAGGHQPIENEDSTVAIAINCEIYNFKELRAELLAKGHRFKTQADSEVALHLYEEYGEAFCKRMVGMWAFALLDMRDPARPRVVLGRDRLGIKPMYWMRTADGIAWASEVKALLALDATPREMRREKLLEFLVQGYCGGADSAWAGIQRLPPASTLSWTAGEEPRVTRYWDLPTDSLSEPASASEVLDWLDRVVREHTISDVPLGAFLSGGVDSSAVVDSYARSMREPVVACSVGFREKTHDELDIARRTAQRLGAIHHTQVLDPDPQLALDVLPWVYDEPLADPSTVPTYLVSRMAREHVTVALSGDGGDETFAGYRRYAHDLAENRLRKKLGSAGRAAIAAAGAGYPKLDWAPRVLRAKTFLTNVGRSPAQAYWHSVTQMSREDALALLAPDVARALAAHDPFDAFEQHYARPAVDDPLYRAQYADFHTYLPDQILAKVDRASMAVSLEVRPPLLDHRFVERFAPLPAREKVRGSRGKHAFREALRARIGPDVLDGAKRGFDTPLKSWIKGPLNAAVRDALETLPSEWFDRDALRARLAAHESGARDHGRLLWSLLVLEHWRRRHRVARLSA